MAPEPFAGSDATFFAVRGEEYRYLTAPVSCEEFLLGHSCETQKTASQQGEGGRLRYWRVGCAGCREGDGPVPLGGEAEGAHGSVEARSGEIGSSAEHRDGNSADHQVRRRDAVDRGRQGANREREAEEYGSKVMLIEPAVTGVLSGTRSLKVSSGAGGDRAPYLTACHP